jgi:hypothetical protein
MQAKYSSILKVIHSSKISPDLLNLGDEGITFLEKVMIPLSCDTVSSLMFGILNAENILRFEVLTAILLRIQISWNVMPCQMSGSQHV